MHSIFSRYFICEEGHITVGDEKKTKCDATEWELVYVKGKRRGSWKAEKKEAGKCGKPIVEEKTIPEKLDLTTVWDYEVLHAFLKGQRLDASFIIGLQEQFSKLWEAVNAKK